MSEHDKIQKRDVPGEGPAIVVEGVGKRYRLFSKPTDRLKCLLGLGRVRPYHELWALREVSFSVARGETVGIVGRNGSGKSTLLEIICGTLPATQGRVLVNGRVSALLELGAGFNPDFTGRENVYVNAALFGLSKKEVDARFERIVDFSELREFIDHQVKTYSSGMFVRLAFAVAVSVDPDILVVDEALAVGDEAFQRKCFSRIQDIREHGGTILMVSHSAGAVVELCDRAMLLDQGEKLLEGEPKEVVARYHKLIFAPPDRVGEVRARIRSGEIEGGGPGSPGAGQTPGDDFDPSLKPKSMVAYESAGAVIEDVWIESLDGRKVNILARGQDYKIISRIRFDRDVRSVRAGALVKTTSGFELGGLLSHPKGREVEFIPRGKTRDFVFDFRCCLNTGTYFLNTGVIAVEEGQELYLHRLVDAAMFKVLPEKEITMAGIVDFGRPSEGRKVAGNPNGPCACAGTEDQPRFQVNRYARQLTSDEAERLYHREFVGGLWDELGRLQLDYLVGQGLLPGHRFLDIGCGCFRGGVWFVDYLDSGNYYGLDCNRSLVKAGYEKEIRPRGLAEKLPRENIQVNDEFDFSGFGVKFDYALALSVFTHLPLNHIRTCLANLWPHMRAGARFYATFFERPEEGEPGPITHEPGGVVTFPDRDPYHYRVSDFEWLVKGLPWEMVYVGAWDHPRAQNMLCFVNKSAD